MSAKFSGEYGGNVVVSLFTLFSVFYFLFAELFAVSIFCLLSWLQ